MTDFHDYLETLILGDVHEAENLLLAGREQFTFPTARPQWAPPRHYNIDHLTVDWKMDLEQEHVDAISKLKITSIVSELSSIFLHAAELEIKSIMDSAGNVLNYDMRPDDEAMYIYFARPLNDGESEEIVFTYSIDHPRSGLWFTGPTSEFPDDEYSAWTQFQDDYARYAIPCFDNPSHKHTAEVSITVPEGYYAMSNGILMERVKNDDGTETFHWYQKQPIPAYLLTVAVSEYKEYIEDLDGLEVSYYAHKKWDKDTVYRSFEKTPAMIKFFVDKLAVPFPFDKYAQVTARRYIFGGMEHASATTQTDATLHDEKAHLDFESDGLVSHELAHMWGGDLVTCRTWSHGWLNEGWATQMQNEWKRHDKGDDEYLYEQYQKQISYFTEDKTQYRRPLVQNEWERGVDVFDRHLYPGGAWRYYMLKHLLGEERWWRILGEYMRRYSYASVYTHDLEAIITEMTGEDYGWFFEQWLYKAGYPECKIKVSHDEKLGHALVKITQTQSSKDGMTPDVFQFPLTVEFVTEDGERKRYAMQVTEKVHSFYYPIENKPKQIIIDPDYAVLMDWKIEKPEPMWIEQLYHGTNIIQRIKAAQALAKKANPKALESLGKALIEDPFWGVQYEIAKALGSVKTESALDQLLKAVSLESSKARTSVATALGKFFQSDRAFEALKNLLDDKESYFVVAAAAASLGMIKHQDSFKDLRDGLKKVESSWHHIMEAGYLSGLAATEEDEVIPILREYLVIGTPDELRRVIPGHLAKLGKRHKKTYPEVKSELENLVLDKSFRVQINALIAVKSYEDSSLIPVLTKLAESVVEGRIIRLAREATRALGKKKEPKEMDSLKKSVEELQKENLDLKDRLAKIESRMDSEKKEE